MSKIISTKTRNINNQRLFNEINDFMLEVFSTLDIYWPRKEHRDEFVFLIDDFLENFAIDSGQITQFDVLCDSRNNTQQNMAKDIYTFSIRYRQTNCLNTTEVDYIVEA